MQIKLIEDATSGEVSVEGWSNEQMKAFIDEHDLKCPKCGAHNFTDIRQFNLMFKTFQGVLEDVRMPSICVRKQHRECL